MGRKKKTWIPVIRRRNEPVLLNSWLSTAYQDQYHQEILLLPRGIYDFKYLDGLVIFEKNDLRKFETSLRERLTLEYLEFIVKKCRRQSNSLLNTAREIQLEAPYDSMTNVQLLSLFSIYSSAVIRVMPFLAGLVILEGVLGKELEDKLKTHVKKHKIKLDSKGYFDSLVFPRERSKPSLAIIELYRLAAKAQSNSSFRKLFKLRTAKALPQMRKKYPTFMKKFNAYLEKYDFMDMEFYVGQPVTAEELFRRIREVIGEASNRLARIKQDVKETEEEFKRASKRLRLTLGLRRLIDLTKAIHYQRQYRADALFKAGRDVLELMMVIGERLGVDYDALLALTWLEISESLIKGKLTIDRKILTARQKDYGMVMEDGVVFFITGDELAKELALLPKVEKKVKELKGNIAFRGTHRGHVAIVTHPDEIDKVKPGDVLVSPMTSPYYVPAMVRAGAIITDEGGVLSHAAIVSRELGVPCIISTKHATQVFKDGDLVEVDAEKGIVRKLVKET